MKASTYCIVLIVLFAGVKTHAACGGGGFKPTQADRERASTTTTSSSTVRSNTVTYTSAPAIAINTSFFDSISAKLELSEEQKKEISRIKYEISDRIVRLKSAQDKAQRIYQECDGACGNETRRLDNATRELQTFDADSEFASRVLRVLKPAQVDTYQRIVKDKSAS